MKGWVLWLALLLPAAAGCLHLQNSEGVRVAAEAKAEFEAILKNPIGDRQIRSHDSQQKLIEEIHSELHKLDFSVQLGALPAMTWGKLREESETMRKEMARKEALAEGEKSEAETKLEELLKKLPDVSREPADLKKALSEASRSAARFAATQKLLSKALRISVGAEEASVQELKKLLDEKISYTEYTEKGESEKSETLSRLLGLKLPELPEKPEGTQDLKKLAAFLKSLPAVKLLPELTLKDPGIATSLLGLSFDVAHAEEQRIRAEIAHVKQLIAAHKAAALLASSIKEALQRQVDHLDRFGATLVPDQVIEVTLRKMAEEAVDENRSEKERNATVKAMQFVYALIARNLKSRILDPNALRMARDRILALYTKRALTQASINLSEREAVIQRGLEGLVAFHESGISPSDLANLMRLGQFVGLGFIADRVD